MFAKVRTVLPDEWSRWCAVTLILLTPGSFVILPLWWLGRQWALRQAPATVNRTER
jgi:hypothetical protein